MQRKERRAKGLTPDSEDEGTRRAEQKKHPHKFSNSKEGFHAGMLVFHDLRNHRSIHKNIQILSP